MDISYGMSRGMKRWFYFEGLRTGEVDAGVHGVGGGDEADRVPKRGWRPLVDVPHLNRHSQVAGINESAFVQ